MNVMELLKPNRNKFILAGIVLLIIVIVVTVTYPKNVDAPKDEDRTYTNALSGIEESAIVSGKIKLVVDAQPTKTNKVVFYLDSLEVGSDKTSEYNLSDGSFDTFSRADGKHSLKYEVYNKEDKVIETKTVNFTIANAPILTNGLKASYYSTEDLSGNPNIQIDPNIDFNWGKTKASNSSIAWEGYLKSDYDETFTFTATSDDGIRVWVNDIQVINVWNIHDEQEDTGKINLDKGRFHKIRVEYFEHENISVAKLAWESKTQPKQIVPATHFYHLK